MKFGANIPELDEPQPLLLRKDIKYNWKSECNSAFEYIKNEMAASRVLDQFDSNLMTVVSNDASAVALSAVLSQLHCYAERPIAFASRIIKTAEGDYSFDPRQALVSIRAFTH